MVDLTTGGYASQSDLANWLNTEPPSNWLQLLRSASILVSKAANRDLYTDTPGDNETAPLRDATTAQAAAWIAQGTDPAKVGTDVRVVTESKIGTADVKFDALSAQDVADAVKALSPEAGAILLSAGLLSLDMPVYTGVDYLPDYGISRPRPSWHDGDTGHTPLAAFPIGEWP